MFRAECGREERHTIDAFAEGDDVAEGHGLLAFCGEMGEDPGTEGDFAVEVALCEAVAAELELGGLDICEVGVEDA